MGLGELAVYFNCSHPCVVLIQCVSPLSHSFCQLNSTCLNPVWYWAGVILKKILSTYFNLPKPNVVLVQRGILKELSQPTSTSLYPVWYWSSVYPQGAIINLFFLTCLNPVWYWSSVYPQRDIIKLILLA